MRHILTMFCFLVAALSCQEPIELGPFPEEPILSELKISKDSVREFTDSLYLEFNYEDATGDLGFVSADQKSLWVKDSRLEHADLFHLQPLGPLDKAVHIQGNLRIYVGSLFLISNDQEEKIIYKIKVRDRAGNWSNEIVSDTLYLLR